jgi:hypothetical protein
MERYAERDLIPGGREEMPPQDMLGAPQHVAAGSRPQQSRILICYL